MSNKSDAKIIKKIPKILIDKVRNDMHYESGYSQLALNIVHLDPLFKDIKKLYNH